LSKSNWRSPGLVIAGLGLIISGAVTWTLLDGTFATALSPSDAAVVPAAVDFVAPPLDLTGLDGRKHSLSDYDGQIVLLNIWATWCPPCVDEMPSLQDFYQRHVQEGFVVVAVNDGETGSAVGDFVKKLGLTFPVWLDPHYYASERAFKTTSLPSSYVIDRRGIVRLMWVGAIDKSNLDEYVAPLIKE